MPILYLRRVLLSGLIGLGGVGGVLKTASAETEEPPFTGPVFLRNDHPLYLGLFSTTLPDRAGTTAPRHWTWRVHYLNSNSAIDQHNVTESERVIIDAELQRVEINLRYAFSRRLEISATLPYLHMGGGYLDGFIHSIEDKVGLTTPGARESRPRGDFRYLVRADGRNLIDETDGSIAGLGDFQIQLKHRFRDEKSGVLPSVSARAMLKLPSATDPLLGNDQVDGGVGLLAEQPIGKRFLLMGSFDLTSAHPTRALRRLDTDPVMVTGSLGFEHFLTGRASWKGQITAANNIYPTFHEDLTVINRPPVGIGFGWGYRLFKGASFQLSVAENLFSAWSDFSWSGSLQIEL